jgi:hypothetical protein
MRKFPSALLLSFFVLALQGYAKGPVLSAELLQARYVALGFETAEGFLGEWETAAFTSANIQPEDRRALSDVHDALTHWKRYVVTIDPRQADMLIAIRSGRLASVNAGVRVHSKPVIAGGPTYGVGTVFGGDVGPRDDYLAVYQADNGQEGARLWRETDKDGLVGNGPPLFRSFKDEVEAFAKKQASKH